MFQSRAVLILAIVIPAGLVASNQPILRQLLGQLNEISHEKRVRALLKQLDSQTFREREEATKQLKQYGEKYIPLIKQFRGQADTLEARRRIDSIVDYIANTKFRSAEVHVVGFYEGHYPTGEGHSGNSHPTGKARVRVTRSETPAVLVLTSYEPIEWKVECEEGANLVQILLSGNHPQSVVGQPEGTPIAELPGRASAYKRGESLEILRATIRQELGKRIATFQGAYSGSGEPVLVKPGAMPSAKTLQQSKVHAVGLYEGQYDGPSHSSGTHPIGTATVRVPASEEPIVLVLMGYEPIRWTIDAADGANIAMIFAGGYYSQSVNGEPRNTPVLIRSSGSYEKTRDAYKKMDAEVKLFTGRSIDTFQGKYAFDDDAFVIDE
ncbi:MAG: hypothetical protein CMJ78_14345 [Planctomycetaceae bacterium]|nr:hypothetical protein [Planctomycetaceae bacterium]